MDGVNGSAYFYLFLPLKHPYSPIRSPPHPLQGHVSITAGSSRWSTDLWDDVSLFSWTLFKKLLVHLMDEAFITYYMRPSYHPKEPPTNNHKARWELWFYWS